MLNVKAECLSLFMISEKSSNGHEEG